MEPAPPRTLAGWKKIAAYLDVTPKTAQNWERDRGLPIHRVPGPGRSMVQAVPEELDEWRKAPPGGGASKWGRASRRLWLLAAPAVVVVVALFAFRAGPGPAYDFRIEEDKTLILLDEEGETVWSRVFPGGLLTGESPMARAVAVADMDGDSEREVLVVDRENNAFGLFLHRRRRTLAVLSRAGGSNGGRVVRTAVRR